MDGIASNVSAFSAATKAITLTNFALPTQVGDYYVLLYIKGYSPAARQMVGYATFSVADPNPSPLWPSATAIPPYGSRRLNSLNNGIEYTVAVAQDVTKFRNASNRALVIPANTWLTTDLLSETYNHGTYVTNTMSNERRVSYANAKNRVYVAPGVYGALGACAAWRTADGAAHTPAYEAWIKATFDASMFKHATRGGQWTTNDSIADMQLMHCSGNYTQYPNTAYWLAYPLLRPFTVANGTPVTSGGMNMPYTFFEKGGTSMSNLTSSQFYNTNSTWWYRWGYTSQQSPKRIGLSREIPIFHNYTLRQGGSGALPGEWFENLTTNGSRAYSLFGRQAIYTDSSATSTAGSLQQSLINIGEQFVELRGWTDNTFTGQGTLLARVDSQVWLGIHSQELVGSNCGAFVTTSLGMMAGESYLTWFPITATGAWSHYQLAMVGVGTADTVVVNPASGWGSMSVNRATSNLGTALFAILGA
jgi:hypothetical protein